MTTESIIALTERFQRQVAAAKTDADGIAHFHDFVRAIAAERASADFLVLESLAQQRLTTEGDPGDLKGWALGKIAEARSNFVSLILDHAGHVKNDQAERDKLAQLAETEHQRAFDGLVRTARGVGHG